MAVGQLHLGTKVRTSDGHDIGDVDQLVVKGGSTQLESIVIDKGMFHNGRIVPMSLIASADENGVQLSIDKNTAENLPEYITEQFIQNRGYTSFGLPSGAHANLQGSGNTWILEGSGGGQIPSTGEPSIIMSPVMGNLVTEQVSSISEDNVVIGEGTDVRDSDGETIGTIKEVILDETNNAVGVIVQAGRFFHHDVHIQKEWIVAGTNDYVRLNVTKAHIEANQP